ncbi:hypothetical protein LMG28614_07080 [Paraburkholderia ultramafica]|uniref:Sortilin N-terminal domain-containing protein n=1 Tax=Paraburkholderia ultramafica TaxID=1544867 RepID=A0A6S7BQC8_9BURK|nr:hypothetical protein [Paraburkholderia ultramafica]CAB3809600.1 hypothetical protein LMG28614_07080 [Paraburkholderia ultramafica]
MESSIDELIEPADEKRDPREGRRPPGGKALLRLQQHLEERGLVEVAQASVERAVADERRNEFDERARAFSAAPPGQASSPAGTDVHAVTAQIAEHYKSVALEEPGPPTGVPTATGPQWRSLGPWTIPNGQTYGSSRVNVSGRVAAIAVDPSNPAHVLCGAANGGVWESFDRGGSWAPRTDYAATLTVGAIVFDPRNPSTVFCGTGEGNWWSWLGAGILKSGNGGTTWSTLCTAPFTGQGFYDLVIDTANTQHMFAATIGGLYVSTDGGVHWTQRRAVQTWSLSITTTEILGACADGLYRSTDGGVSWNPVALPGSPGTFNRLAVSIARSDASVAYAWGANGATAYLWRRAGTAWTAQPIPPGVATGQAWYDWYCACAPDNANQIYLGAIESYRGDLSGNTWTWRTISNKGASGDSIHPDQHAIAFEPGRPDTIYVGCDGGLYRSPDRGITWTSCNNGLVISEFEYLAQNFGSSRWVIGGTQDNGTERWTGSPVWTHVADGDGGDCAINRTTPNTVFHTYYSMSPERSTTGGDFGSWTYLPPPVPAGEGSLFYPPMDASASGGDTIAIGGDALYVSRNNMTSWTRLPFPSAARSSAMYVPNANTLYVGSTDGRIFRTTWNGSAWGAVSALATPRANANMSDILVDPSNSNRLWVTYTTMGGGRVYRSDNGGSSWTDMTHNLPNLPLTAIDVDTWNSNRVWVAADLGVYQTLDGGATWADFSASLPNAFIGDIVFHPHARVLRAGTRNRGVWEIPVDGWMTTPVCGVQWTGSLNPNETKRWFTWGWPATWHMIWTIMPSTVKPGAPELTWTVQVQRADAEYATYWISVQNLTNVPVTFEGRYCILSRY